MYAGSGHKINATAIVLDEEEDWAEVLSRYNLDLVKEVTINGNPTPANLVLLVPLHPRVITIDPIIPEELEELEDVDTLIDIFQHLADTLERLNISTDGTTEFFDTITFPRLTHLELMDFLHINAPSLTTFDVGGQNEPVIDLRDLLARSPNIERFLIHNGGSLYNASLLNQFPLSELVLNQVTLDAKLVLTGLNLVRFTLTWEGDADEPGQVLATVPNKLPRTLEHLTLNGKIIDTAILRKLKLKTLNLSSSAPDQTLTKIKLSHLHSLKLSEFNLTDAFFIDGPVLTELDLSGGTVTYTSFIQAPLLRIVKLAHVWASDFLPDRIIELSLFNCTGAIVRSVKSLINLRVLNVSGSEFKLKWIRKLHLTSLQLHHCNLTSLKYLRNMRTLRSLDVAFNPLGDNALLDIQDLPLITLNIGGTEITDTGLKALRHMPLKELVLTKITGSGLKYLRDLKLVKLALHVERFNPKYLDRLREFPVDDIDRFAEEVERNQHRLRWMKK